MREEKMITLGKRVLAVCLLFAAVLAFQYTARAENYLLESMGKQMFAGDRLTLSAYFNAYELEEIDSTSISYTIDDTRDNPDSITVTAEGTVTAVKKGTAVILVRYRMQEEEIWREDSFTVKVLSPEQLTAAYGGTVWLSAFDLYYPSVFQDGDGEETDNQYSFSRNSIAWDTQEKQLTVCGFQTAKVYLNREFGKVLVAEITIRAPKFKKSKIARAVKTEAFCPALTNYTPAGKNGTEQITWTSDNKKIAAGTKSGIRAKAAGTTKIHAVIKAQNGDKATASMKLTVTNPKVPKKLVLAEGLNKKLTITGMCSYSTYKVVNADSLRYCSLSGKKRLYAEMEGKEKIKLQIDGRVLPVLVVVTNPNYEGYKFTMYKGLKKKLSISGLSKKYSKVTYQTGNARIARVSKSGKVTAKKAGVTRIKVNADGRKLTIWVEIATKKAYRAAKKEIAISKTKTHYSQAKRMSAGYYDCSSLVSRVYRQYGVYFGSKSGWSPTAAAIGQWCSSHHKVIARTGISDTKLVPGDLIFYSYEKNGRYLDISHVEMYVGNGMDVSASSSNNKVIYYNYSPYSVVMIARPTK